MSPRIAILKTGLKRVLPVLAVILLVLHLLRPSATTTPVISEPQLVIDAINYHPILFSNKSEPLEPSVRSTEDFGIECLEKYFMHGEPCHTTTKPVIDVVWTWVNGSDPVFDALKTKTEEEIWKAEKPSRPPKSLTEQKCYRDNDELRYSMRAARENFGQHSKHFHLITADFLPVTNASLTSEIDPKDVERIGQIPQWLDHNSANWEDEDIKLSIVHHSQFFDSYDGTVFSALAIESQFPNLPISSQTFIYINDDMYMNSPMNPTDWYTPEYGLLLRMQPGLLVDWTLQEPDSEWKSLRKSNFLLGHRFGDRKRPYLTHLPKGFSMPMLSEIKQIWASDIDETRQQKFPKVLGHEGSFNTQFAMSHFIIERWREGLLFSWIVGKIGGDHDEWDLAIALKELKAVEPETTSDTELVISGYDRDTMVNDRIGEVFKSQGYDKGQTTYGFTNMDGYPYSNIDRKQTKNAGWKEINDFRKTKNVCTLRYQECFGDTTRASEIFTRVAFDKPRCGDCLIHALVKASGKLGLSAFLPPATRVLREESAVSEDVTLHLPPPHLPLVKDWHDGDFTLAGSLGPWSTRAPNDLNVREWTMKMLMRYRFSLGDTPSYFVALITAAHVEVTIRKLKVRMAGPNSPALICLNDNLRTDNSRVRDYFHDWQVEQWGQQSFWETPFDDL